MTFMSNVSLNSNDARQIINILKGSAVVVALSIFVAHISDAQFYSVWAGFIGICTIPILIVLTGVYLPKTNLGWLQPGRFLTLSGIVCVVALVIGLAAYSLFPGFSSPNLVQSTWVTLAIIVAVFHVYVFDLWPLQSFSKEFLQKRPSLLALFELFLIYIIAYILLAFIGFDTPSHPIFGSLVESTYGIGIWHFLAFGYTALLVNAILALFDITALNVVVDRWPLTSIQPLRGILFFTVVAILTGVILSVFRYIPSFRESFYLATLVIPCLMAVFLVQENTGYQWLAHRVQPIRGLIRSLGVLVLSVILFYIYQWASVHIAGLDAFYTPSLERELWMMNTMLSVGYPVIIIYCHFIKPAPH